MDLRPFKPIFGTYHISRIVKGDNSRDVSEKLLESTRASNNESLQRK